MIIDTSYFLTKEVLIPNAVVQPSIGSNAPSSLTQLKEFSHEKEEELLLNFLGYAQLNELKAQFEDTGAWKANALDKWKNLVDGVGNWKGLRFKIGTSKYSLIAYYVYFYYIGLDFKQYSTTGFSIPVSKETLWQSPNQSQTRAWNKFVKMYQGNKSQGATFFTNWNGQGVSFMGSSGNEVSLYEYMATSKLYDMSYFNFEKPINPWGL